MKIKLSDPNTTYWKNKKMEYEIEVSDLEDGNTTDTTLDPSKIKVTLNYIPEGEDMILASIGHQQNAIPKGLQLIESSDCKACHAIDKKVAGPSYNDIALRYDQEDKQGLIHRIVKGSQGIWGENMMAPHPQLKLQDVGEIVDYILSLDRVVEDELSSMPLAGSIEFDEHLSDAVAGKYVFMASYLDNGHPEIEGSSLSVVEKIVFSAPKLEMENASHLDEELGVWESQGRRLVGSIRDGRQIKFDKLSFENLSSISIGAAFNKEYAYGGKVEVRVGSAEGPLLGEGVIQFLDEKKDGFKVFEISLKPSNEVDILCLVFVNSESKDQYVMNGDWIQLNYNK